MKTTFTYANRVFEIYSHRDGSVLFEMSVYEVVRPTWKLFRTRYFGHKWFFLDDYSTVEEGLKAGLAQLLTEEKEETERDEKVAKFFNSTY